MKNNPVFVITTFALFFAVIWYVATTPALEYDKEIMQQKIDSLQASNDKLLKSIQESNLKIDSAYHRIDSLEELKRKTIIKYIHKKNEIDTASFGYLVHDFDSIFTANHIKR